MKVVCVVVSFVIVLCGCLVLEIVTVDFLKVCAVALEVGSSASVAWSWFHYVFDLIAH